EQHARGAPRNHQVGLGLPGGLAEVGRGVATVDEVAKHALDLALDALDRIFWISCHFELLHSASRKPSAGPSGPQTARFGTPSVRSGAPALPSPGSAPASVQSAAGAGAQRAPTAHSGSAVGTVRASRHAAAMAA